MASRGSKKVIYAALTGNLLIGIAKLQPPVAGPHHRLIDVVQREWLC